MTTEPMHFTGWTAHATRFVRPPTLSWSAPTTAVRFRVQVTLTPDTCETLWTDEAQCDLTVLWPRITHERIDVLVTAVDAAGGELGGGVSRRIHKVPGAEAVDLTQAPLDYRASVRRNLDYLLAPARDAVAAYEQGWPRSCWSAFEENETGQRTRLGYPALHHPSFIFAYLAFAAAFSADPRAAEAGRQARLYGRWLLEHRLPAEWTCGLFPYSTIHEGRFGGGIEGQSITLFRAARVGAGMIRLHQATGEAGWLAYARHLADLFVRLQRADGTWPYRVDPRDGTVQEDYTSNVVSPACFLGLLEDLAPEPRYADARRKAVAWMLANPVRTHRWQGMYEDVGQTRPFENLQHFDVDEAILYLTHFRADDPAFVPTAQALNSWVEDQFVVWGRESALPVQPPTPAVLEQYVCYWPMECHTARWLLGLLALHSATGAAEYLAKAVAAGNAIVRGQQASGAYSTWGNDLRFGRPVRTADWPGCNALAVTALLRLDGYLRSPADKRISLEGC